MNTTVYVCEDNFENILTAIYHAWASRKGHSNVRLELAQEKTMELFCEYVNVITDLELAEKVSSSIDYKISHEVWQIVYRASMSWDPGKADAIYRFLIGGFHYGKKVTQMLSEPAVQKIFELNRQVSNEAHFFREFVRFDAMSNNILLSKIRPKSNILSMIVPHFVDRLSGENFMILDVGRNLAAIHQVDKPWFLMHFSQEEVENILSHESDVYKDLWKTFYNSIAIAERINPKLQRNMMPLRYREFTTEHN